MDNSIKKTLNLLGLGTNTFLIEDIEIDYKYFTPENLENDITDEAIDGNSNEEITTHVKTNNMILNISGTLSNISSILTSDFADKYERLIELTVSKKSLRITGTKFDDKNWVIKSITKTGEGLNYIDFDLVLREVKFVQTKNFTYPNTIRGRAEYKPVEKLAKTDTKILAWDGGEFQPNTISTLKKINKLHPSNINNYNNSKTIINFENKIPFIQKVDICGKEFEFEFYWRKEDDSIMLDLRDSNSNLLIEGEVLRYNLPLFYKLLPDDNGNIRQDFPQQLIIPLSPDGIYKRVGIETIFNSVHLTLKTINPGEGRAY